MTQFMPAPAAGAPGPVYRRPVLPVERFFMAYPTGKEPIVQLFVEGIGALDEVRVRAAVQASSAVCPGTRLVRRRGKWVATGPTPPVRVVDGDSVDRVTFEGLPALQNLPAGPKGTTCEVLILDGAKPGLLFRALHVVMDGGGCLLWATETFRALRGESLEPATSTVSYRDLVRDFPPAGTPPRLEWGWASPIGQPEPGVTPEFLWRRRTIDGGAPAMSAKIATAITRAAGLETGRFTITVDMRRHDRDIRSTANFSKLVIVDAHADQPWENVYAELLIALNERREMTTLPDSFGQWLPIPLIRAAIKAGDRKSPARGYLATATLTDLGRLEMEAFSADGFEARAVVTLTTAGPGSPPEIDIIGCGNHTEILLAWWAGEETAKRADALLDAIVESFSPKSLRHWPGNKTGRELRDDRSVVAQFHDRVTATPDATAISAPEERLSYAELDRRSDAVAVALRARGVCTGSVVGILADRSVLSVVAVWGVLKSGAAYLPLDAKHPAERVRWLLSDSGAPVCLVQRPHEAHHVMPEGCLAIVLDELPHEPDSAPRLVTPAPDDLAYVIYTSGSTGKPKGVEIQHGALTNYAEWCADEHGISEDSKLPLLVSLSFDVSGISLIVPLVQGGTIMVMGQELNHLALQEVFDRGATVLALTPSHLDLIGRLDLRSETVRTLIVIGEQFRRVVALRAQELFGLGCRIVNHYGPAEATIGVTSHVFDAAADTAAVVPIGRPGYNTTAFVLDESGGFIPEGEAGELYLGGAQLARGYRARPDLTRQRYVRMADGSRVYRTGDIARLLPSGELEVIGRVDDQVKILGHRVEPEEISQTLDGHPAVSRATVVVHSRREQKFLVGYVVPEPAALPLDPEELAAYLAQRLPDYMIPATLLIVEDIPLSVNGKVDIHRLPGVPQVASVGSDAEVPDELEAQIRAVWATVLEIEPDRIGPETDFHTLGGDSLTLLAMVGTVAKQILGGDAEESFVKSIPEIAGKATVRRIAQVAKRVMTTP